MRRMVCILAFILLFFPFAVRAQDSPLTVEPSTLVITGTVGNGPLAASLRLTAGADVSGVRLFVSDLVDATGDDLVRDPLPSSAVTLLPENRFETLTAGSLTQVVVQVAPPAATGVYTGTLIVRWEKPSPGQVEIPLKVKSRTRPAVALQHPIQVTISGEQGNLISRHVTLRETVGGSTLAGLRAIPQDLVAAEGGNALPASKIGVDLPADEIAGGDILTATLKINLQDVSAGSYTGQVLFTANSGELLSLPVTVNVRHGPVIPTIVLIIGVLMGLGLSAYMVRGKPRDELVVRVASVRQAMKDDDTLHESFGPRLNTELDEAESHIRIAQWEEAGTTLVRAEGIVRKWRNARHAWVAQLTYIQEKLLPRLPDDENAAWTLRKLRHQVEDAQHGAADFDTPTNLRDRIFEIEQTLARFETLEQRLVKIGETRVNAPVPAEMKNKWQSQESELRQQLHTLLPDETEKWKQLEADILALSQQIAQDIQEQGETAKGAETRGWLTEALQPLLPAGLYLPEVGQISTEAGQAAQRRLLNIGIITYILSAMLLAGVGYGTLYESQPTFGAHWIADYLALLTWGLGAQTTVGAVVNLLKGWDIPFGKKSDA